MGTLTLVIPFPLSHIQAQYILRILEGKKLPSREDMYEEFKKEKKSLLDKGVAVSFSLSGALNQKLSE